MSSHNSSPFSQDGAAGKAGAVQTETARSCAHICGGAVHIPFVFSSNGDGFVFQDRTGASAPREANLALEAFPSPAELWAFGASAVHSKLLC